VLKIIKFYKDGCEPCVEVGANLTKVGFRNKESINVELNPEKAAEFSVTRVPTLIFMKDGSEVTRRSGMMSSSVIERIINGIQGVDQDEEDGE
jgi:thioredoxin 1